MKSVCLPSYLLPKRWLLAACVTGMALANTGHSQIGTGWTPFFPTSFLDVESSNVHTHYDLTNNLTVDGVQYTFDSATSTETYKLTSNASNRLEREADEHYTNGSRQMQGDVKISQLSDQSVHQIFHGGSPWVMCKGYGANGGELRKQGNSVVLISGIENTWVRWNWINRVGTGWEMYCNGTLRASGSAPLDGSGYNNKYGLYGTKTTTAPTVQWKNVHHFKDGSPGYFKIIARHSGKALNVSGASLNDGASVIQWPYSSGNVANDEWQIIDVGGGYCRIMNRNSGKALNVEGVSTIDGAHIIQWTYSDNSLTNDEWQILEVAGGYYKILNRNSGKALNVEGASTADGAQIIQWTYSANSTYNDEWEITSVP